MTIWLLRSVRYSLAISMVWRADCFQSIARRSMPWRIVGQRLELGALADLELGDLAVHRVAVDASARSCSRTARMSGVISTAWPSAELALLPDQAERPGPAHPDAVEPRRAAPLGAAARPRAAGAAWRRLARAREAERRVDRPGRRRARTRRRAGAGRRSGRARSTANVSPTLTARGPSQATSALRAARRRAARRPAPSAEQQASSARPAGPVSRARAAPISSATGATAAASRIGAAGRDRSHAAPRPRRSAARSRSRPAGPRSRRRPRGCTRWRSTAGASALTSSGMT